MVKILKNDHDLNLKFVLFGAGTINFSMIDETSFLNILNDSMKEKETKHLSYSPVLAVLIYGDSKTELAKEVADEYKEILQHVDKFESKHDPDFNNLLELL